MTTRIGVITIQGDVEEHVIALEKTLQTERDWRGGEDKTSRNS